MASWTAYSTWTPQKPTLFDGHYLRNRSTLDIGVSGYIGIVQHKEHSSEVLSIPPGTPCISCIVHHNIHLLLHWLWDHPVLYSHRKPSVNIIYQVLPSGHATMYYMLNAQLFLQPQLYLTQNIRCTI